LEAQKIRITEGKRKASSSSGDSNTQNKRRKQKDGANNTTNTTSSMHDILAQDVVTPLWRYVVNFNRSSDGDVHRVPYEQQLETKKQKITKTFEQLARQLRQESKYAIPKWIKGYLHMLCYHIANRVSKNTFCELEGILPSPVTTSYRNKMSFTIGLDIDNKVSSLTDIVLIAQPCVGSVLGRTENGVFTIGV
jgi:hypothetical protein